ncbi:MAG: HD domain-containing protein [Candidatus Wildermuthbacteria bacterium]|nr:HD domain-containing protein [Candidatus Wildermuthbacteria bacterium]
MKGSIFSHILNRSLAHVMRFSSKPQHFKESVAEHSFFVAYIVSILCELLKEAGEKIDAEKALRMALVHDIEETFSGDILGPFKHHSLEVSLAIQKVNKEVIAETFQNLPQSLAGHFVSLWTEEGEGKSIEAQVVKSADRLSLIAKCAEEVKTGNTFFKEIYETQLSSLRQYHVSWWDKIKGKVLPRE